MIGLSSKNNWLNPVHSSFFMTKNTILNYFFIPNVCRFLMQLVRQIKQSLFKQNPINLKKINQVPKKQTITKHLQTRLFRPRRLSQFLLLLVLRKSNLRIMLSLERKRMQQLSQTRNPLQDLLRNTGL